MARAHERDGRRVFDSPLRPRGRVRSETAKGVMNLVGEESQRQSAPREVLGPAIEDAAVDVGALDLVPTAIRAQVEDARTLVGGDPDEVDGSNVTDACRVA